VRHVSLPGGGLYVRPSYFVGAIWLRLLSCVYRGPAAGARTFRCAGEVLRTTDGGATWQDVSPPGSAGLLFRDVEAQRADRASVL
jgi:hypothetical protein